MKLLKPNTSPFLSRTFTSLSNILSQGDNIKSQVGTSTYYANWGVWYPEFLMYPNEGYMLNTAQSGLLIYPDSSDDAPAVVDNDFNFHRSQQNVFVNGKAVIRITDTTACGDPAVEGSKKVFVKVFFASIGLMISSFLYFS